ncbi:hypothetical protein Aple_064790 [Acrocarpospora pleiomorpha]|uniref:Uncharacterized protein n=1 Tax=Acrocarpospora pleiomorpha TaxID=90975 RepID=A0A5M3XS01_9ACTN|nr:hypothetical protein [Acrocarpospora pleiomorpha]GES23580.1 hypothetical protein Aple_064790 [Acrocarpospora pleiomorpha]
MLNRVFCDLLGHNGAYLALAEHTWRVIFPMATRSKEIPFTVNGTATAPALPPPSPATTSPEKSEGLPGWVWTGLVIGVVAGLVGLLLKLVEGRRTYRERGGA